MLIPIKQYLKQQRRVSFSELIHHFNLDPEILYSMLKVLINKGQIRQQNKTSECGKKCVKCHPFVTEIYEWVLKEA